MALVPSTMPELGLPAPRFNLPDTAGRTVSIDDFSDAPVLLVAFWCSHCPFVRHIREGFAAFAREYQAKNVTLVAISSNDEVSHPQDGPEQMRADVEAFGYTFHTCAMPRRKSRMLTRPHARRISFSTTKTGSWSTGAGSMERRRAMTCRSPEKTCARR